MIKKIVTAISVVAVVPIVVATCTLTVAALVFASATQNSNSSTTQNSNSSTTTNKSVLPGSREISPPATTSAPTPDFSKNTWELPEDADKTKNPIDASAESIAKGKELYLTREKGNCIFCHGEAGSGNEANLPRLRRKPADLSNKVRMSTRTDGELFWKITKGINGIMPAGERRMTEAEERWNVVNYVRTLAKEPPKP